MCPSPCGLQPGTAWPGVGAHAMARVFPREISTQDDRGSQYLIRCTGNWFESVTPCRKLSKILPVTLDLACMQRKKSLLASLEVKQVDVQQRDRLY